MLSTFPVMLPNDGLLANQFPVFEGGFTPWDTQEPPFDLAYHDEPVASLVDSHEPVLSPEQIPEPVVSNSSSDNSNPKPTNSSSGLDEPKRKRESPNSRSDETNREVSTMDDRKRRRMVSNRESARRSRMRKQKHLENLRSQVNRLRIGNRELMNRLRLVTHHCHLVRSENVRLRSESNILVQRLCDIRQVLYVREVQQQMFPSAWPCNTIITPSINEELMPQSSLIT